MQQGLAQKRLTTGLHALVLLASLASIVAAEPLQQDLQLGLQQPSLPKPANHNSSGAHAVTEETHQSLLGQANTALRKAAQPSDGQPQQCCTVLPTCDKPVPFEVLVPPAIGICPVEAADPAKSAEALIPGVEPFSEAPNITDVGAAPVQQKQAAAKQQHQPSDSSEEERHNFALTKDGAKIVGSNKEAKKSSAILDTDSDTFMKNECKADKWFIIELSQVAKVDAFQLSQYELYSSRVKDFEVRGRRAHPRVQGGDYSKTLNTTGWQMLGKYTAAKMKGSQTFTAAEPAWLKYLQFHFITHHGSEPICALNDVLVFGKSAAEDLEDQLSDEALLTEAEDSADAKQADAAKLIKADGSTELTSQQAKPISLTGQPQGGSDSSAHADARSELGSHNASGSLPISSGSSAGKVTDAEQQALDQAASLPRSGKQDMQQQGGASEHIPQEPAALPDLTAHKVHAVEMEDEALLQPAAPESKADAHAEGRTDAYSEELVLPQNSAGSTKARHGGSIYDMLVQEIKSLKLQQKQTPRQLAELHRNLSMYMEKTAAEMSALDQAMKGLQADLDLMQRTKIHPVEDSNNAVATLSDVDIDLRAVLLRLESMQQALHQVQHRVTAIVLLAIIAWLGVVVLTAPALGQLTWILWIPIFLIAAIGVVWLVPCIFRIFPSAL